MRPLSLKSTLQTHKKFKLLSKMKISTGTVVVSLALSARVAAKSVVESGRPHLRRHAAVFAAAVKCNKVSCGITGANPCGYTACGTDKYHVCHYSTEEESYETLCLPPSAISSHLAHHSQDYCGECLIESPTIHPSESPSESSDPSESPSETPSSDPTESPSVSSDPSESPSEAPSSDPTESPSVSSDPSESPSEAPSRDPSESPSVSSNPSESPSSNPSECKKGDVPTGYDCTDENKNNAPLCCSGKCSKNDDTCK